MAITDPSSRPEKTSPPPRATPRLSQPQHTVVMLWSRPERYSHNSWPVRASNASTSSLPEATYITPFWTIGVASNEYFASRAEPVWATQAAFRFLTLDVVIWSSAE